MAEQAKKIEADDDFSVELEGEEVERGNPAKPDAAPQQRAEPDIEVEDDTPEADRGRTPLPKHLVEELEADELEDYSDKVKTRLKQMKKVWHDERREKERAMREQQEAVQLAKQMLEENNRLKTTLSDGEKTLIQSYHTAAQLEFDAAKRAYKEAYESGDSDKVVDAQNKLANANYKLAQIQAYRPTLQTPSLPPTMQTVTPQRPVLDAKTQAWQERNTWWGTDEEMTASALGLHQKLLKQHGDSFVGTDEYWRAVDETMQRRFPEYFGEQETPPVSNGKANGRTETKPATVVAPASRSTSSKRIVLKQSQVSLAKKLGLTPEQYAREMQKLQKLEN